MDFPFPCFQAALSFGPFVLFGGRGVLFVGLLLLQAASLTRMIIRIYTYYIRIIIYS